MQRPSFDPGLTQQFTSPFRRVINKDGSFNVHRRGTTWRDIHPYLFLINMGWVQFFASLVFGYFVAGSFALCALLKPIHPQTAGLWLLPDPEDAYSFSLRLGFSSPPPHGRELLGWWIVPLGLVFAMGLVLFTFHLGLWSIRKFWHPLRGLTLTEAHDE